MFRFFRKIRHRLFLEGKVLRYIGYAIGEIALIVIGILIAVKIADWKDEIKLDQRRTLLIENLKLDFQSNLERLEVSISVADVRNADLKEFLRVATADNSHLSVAELKTLNRNGLVPITFRPALGTYHAANNDGSISLIGDTALTELFIDFEKNYSYYLINQNMDREGQSTGSMSVRRRIGSLDLLLEEPHREVPEAYVLSDQQYRELIAQMDVYSFFEEAYDIGINQQFRLQNVKETTLEILASLEAL